ncbi:outer membrane protein assembly factor BamB family protein [Rubinisphaera margarita]|uniref:outer membrane protein assembly factor BamB family protein n=1 Tax=Rubinisphaera margarita TaxID=2909586 RepID=UPI001EE9A899|nr:PQQ-binding-like beta-propeller repeat protein [Rubinisphaera margarita]MCG6155091.1 PQQ-binding-like beta-propeller repeat protein [Rubinisphaera margarita]
MQRLLRNSIFLLVLSVGLSAVAADSWPQFRGPGGQGHATESSLPLKFDEETNLRWKQAIRGEGWSSAVARDDQLWLTTAVLEDEPKPLLRLYAVGLDPETGSIRHEIELFQVEQPEKIHDDNSYASPTPVIDEHGVYCHFGTFGTAAIDYRTGKILWKNDSFEIDHQGGPGSSPVPYENLLILTCDGANVQFVVALDKQSGEEVWKTTRTAPLRDNSITHRAFATPLIWNHGGRDLLISPGPDQAHAYEPATGKELWHVRYVGFSNVPAPVTTDSLVFLCTGFFETELLAVEPGGSGNVTESHVKWTYTRSVSTVPSPIVVDDKLFSINEAGLVACLDCTTGKVLGKRRLIGKYSASPIYANGRLYFCSEEGKISVLAPDSDMELLQVNRLDGLIKASPSVVEDTLYLRTATHLYRIEDTAVRSGP